MTEGDLTQGGEYVMQYTEEVLWNRTLRTHVIGLTNVTAINSIKNK